VRPEIRRRLARIVDGRNTSILFALPVSSPFSLLLLLLLFLFRPPVLHSRGPLEIMHEKKTRTRCVSAGYVALPPQNCRIGETDGIKALHRKGKALKKEKCLKYLKKKL